MIIAIVPITFDVTRISGAEVCFLVVDESSCWFTVNSRLLFSIDSSKVWFTSLQTQIHDVVFIIICVTSLVVDFNVVVVVGVVVVVDIVVVVVAVVVVAIHKSGLVIGLLLAK